MVFARLWPSTCTRLLSLLCAAGLASCVADVGNQATAGNERQAASLANGISAGYVPPAAKQGASEARLAMAPDVADRRYARLQQIGIGYRQYNLWWSSLESSGRASTLQPASCPAGYVSVPRDASEKARQGFHRYRCVSQAHLALFDDLLRRDAAAGMQSGVVLWSSPEVYRYSGCEGFPWAGGTLRDGCVPRDDAMDDFEDYVNLVAARYGGGGNGKIQHFIVWNENASDGWFDYSPVVPRGSTAAPQVAQRIDKYAEMMQRAHRAIARHSRAVMLYASTDLLWAPDLEPGHFGSRQLLEGLWQRLGTDIAWSVAVHPYGDVEQAPPDGRYSFANLEIVARLQQEQLQARGVQDPSGQAQAYLVASEQGWPRAMGATAQARAICAAHAKATSLWNLVAVAHNYFHSVEPQESQGGLSSQGSFFGLLPYEVSDDLSNMLDHETGQAYASTGPAVWNVRADHYCCSRHAFGCPPAATPASHPVTGNVDGVVERQDRAVVRGWACARGVDRSIDVHVYRGGPAGSGVLVGHVRADLPSEGAVAAACATSHSAHRFELPLGAELRQQHAGQLLYVHGISPTGGEHRLLTRSAEHAIPALALDPTPAPSSATRPIHRFYNPGSGDHLLTVESSVAAGSGYHLEGVAFEVFTAGGAQRAEIYRCYAATTGDHFVSRDPGCEGMQQEGAYGWVASSACSEAPRPLYGCFSASAGDHLTTVDRAECVAAGYVVEGIQGYVR